MEKCIFPMKTMNITQGVNGGYSHKGTFCIDNAGEDSGIDNVYAPYTGKIVQIYADTNTVFFESINKVKCADGDECFVTSKFTHDNNIADLYLGKIINQGVRFYNEGTKGNATGNHIDLSVAKGKNQGYIQNSQGNWMLKGSIEPWKVFFVNTTKSRIWNGYNYPWVLTDSDTYEPKLQPKGYLDNVSLDYIYGWAYLGNNPIAVHVYIYDSNGIQVGFTHGTADLFRQDLKDVGIGNGNHGFNIPFDFRTLGNGTYTVRAYGIGGDNPQLINEHKITVNEPKPIVEPPKEPIIEPIKEEPKPIEEPIAEPPKEPITEPKEESSPVIPVEEEKPREQAETEPVEVKPTLFQMIIKLIQEIYKFITKGARK